jgi:hypothetical protein
MHVFRDLQIIHPVKLKMTRRIFIITGVILFAALSWGIIYLDSLLPIITGYPAKYLCSAVFVSNRQVAETEALDLNFSFIRFVKNDVSYREKSVTSHFLWGSSKAIYREGLGSTLLRDVEERDLRNRGIHWPGRSNYNQDTISWPLGNRIPGTKTGIDEIKMLQIMDDLFVRNRYHGNAFAFMVVHKGIPVAERYRKGFTAGTRFLSWSMAKSFMNALTGIMVKDGKMKIHQKAAITEWQNDGRKQITVNDLLQMQSGLKWNEDYGNRSDVTLMLYNTYDCAGYAYNKPLESPPGSHWYYSSGSTNIVSFLLRQQFNGDDEYYSFCRERLFNKTGMPDAVMETDAAGTTVGSSYIYATARDYARFGLLYLRDGMFNGERILPAGWVEYSTTPASHSNGSYGAFFWLNKGKHYPSAPADMFYCNGHDGQRIFIIPSRDLVIIVLGYSPKGENEMDFNSLLGDILEEEMAIK